MCMSSESLSPLNCLPAWKGVFRSQDPGSEWLWNCLLGRDYAALWVLGRSLLGLTSSSMFTAQSNKSSFTMMLLSTMCSVKASTSWTTHWTTEATSLLIRSASCWTFPPPILNPMTASTDRSTAAWDLQSPTLWLTLGNSWVIMPQTTCALIRGFSDNVTVTTLSAHKLILPTIWFRTEEAFRMRGETPPEIQEEEVQLPLFELLWPYLKVA